ncbi:MAG: 4Fe-4S dicluster domain-containing protein [Eggerthellaceae bacterium]|nr:4Fe-4S dicluster domain-containing protein [Eggerthellaceae bacterium]
MLKGGKITRREFIASGIAAVAVLTGALNFRVKKLLCRPPGAQTEKRFLSLCVRCNRCVEACPQRVIEPVLFGGLLELRTPWLNFRKSYCNFCHDAGGLKTPLPPQCVVVCPTAALGTLKLNPAFTLNKETGYSKEVRTFSIGLAKINTDFCPQHCDVCKKACPYFAIELDDNGYAFLTENRCNGCGACEFYCPEEYVSKTGEIMRAVTVVPNGARLDSV